MIVVALGGFPSSRSHWSTLFSVHLWLVREFFILPGLVFIVAVIRDGLPPVLAFKRAAHRRVSLCICETASAKRIKIQLNFFVENIFSFFCTTLFIMFNVNKNVIWRLWGLVDAVVADGFCRCCCCCCYYFIEIEMTKSRVTTHRCDNAFHSRVEREETLAFFGSPPSTALISILNVTLRRAVFTLPEASVNESLSQKNISGISPLEFVWLFFFSLKIF